MSLLFASIPHPYMHYKHSTCISINPVIITPYLLDIGFCSALFLDLAIHFSNQDDNETPNKRLNQSDVLRPAAYLQLFV